MARPRSSGLNDWRSTACESGCSAPPVAPCTMRNSTSDGKFGASPQSTDAAVNPAVDAMSSRLRPSIDANHPVSGRTIAFATRYEVRAHVASSVVAAMLLAMCGSDTFTTVVSSTSMKVANITAIATIQGLTFGATLIALAIRSLESYLVYTVGVTDIPGRNSRSESWPAFKTIFTGTRCTTLTKLPLAFSGGSRLNRAPVAGAML